MKTTLIYVGMSTVIGSLLLGLPPSLSAQGTVVFGTRTRNEVVPFGSIKPGEAYFTNGQYQQIYDASGFTGPLWITGVSFAQDISDAGTDTYTFSLGLGTTLRTPDNPGETFDPNFTTVFSGSLSPVFTAAPNDFDFAINLSTVFFYDPAQGNLLLNITMFSATTTNSAFALDGNSSTMSRLWSRNFLSLGSQSHSGLVTEFTVVPEPSPLGLLLLGSLIISAQLVRQHVNLNHPRKVGSRCRRKLRRA